MNHLHKSGRWLPAIAIFVFGIIQLINMHFMSGLLPVPQQTRCVMLAVIDN